MYHYTTGKHRSSCIITCYYEGFHSQTYDKYFDDFTSSHIEFAKFNNMDYHSFNGDLRKHLGISNRFSQGCVGIMKWYAAWYCINELGYEDVMVVDVDTKFLKMEKLSSDIQSSELAASSPWYWHFTDAAWVMYALYRSGATVQQVSKLKNWYNTGVFKVNNRTGFKPYLDRYVDLIKAVSNEETGLMSNTPHTGWYKRRIMAPYDEGFLQYFIALSGKKPDVYHFSYNTGQNIEGTVLFHFTDKNLISKMCKPGNKMLNHSED